MKNYNFCAFQLDSEDHDNDDADRDNEENPEDFYQNTRIPV